MAATRKRVDKDLAEAAVQWLVSTEGATYPDAVRRFPGTTENALRGLVKRRWGSQGAARMAAAQTPSQRLWQRPCVSCGGTDKRPKGQYRCNRCLVKASQIYEGGV